MQPDTRILKPQNGEIIEIDSRNMSDQDCEKINKLIELARSWSDIKKIKIN